MEMSKKLQDLLKLYRNGLAEILKMNVSREQKKEAFKEQSDIFIEELENAGFTIPDFKKKTLKQLANQQLKNHFKIKDLMKTIVRPKAAF